MHAKVAAGEGPRSKEHEQESHAACEEVLGGPRSRGGGGGEYEGERERGDTRREARPRRHQRLIKGALGGKNKAQQERKQTA